MTGHIFISYANLDGKGFATTLYTRLKSAGFKAWMDTQEGGIRVGEVWHKEIERAIDDCAALVFVMTPGSIASEVCGQEVEYALSQKKLLIPLKFLPAKIPLRLIDKQYVDFIKYDYETAFGMLVSRLRGDTPPVVSPPPDAPTLDLAPLAARLNLLSRAGFPLPEWVAVKGATATLGDAEIGIAEHTVTIAPFLIAKTPVTQTQYRTFIANNTPPHRVPYDDWGDLKRYSWRDAHPPSERLTHPVVLVNAFDAEAYAAWLMGFYGADLPSGWCVALPSAVEWEYAARGTTRRLYPWGMGDPNARLANYSGTDTSPVGAYPDGISATGCLDMAGNVWEWTRTPDSEDDALRVLRGGSWRRGEAKQTLRCAYHFADAPEEINQYYGFRPVIVKLD